MLEIIGDAFVQGERNYFYQKGLFLITINL